MCATCTDRTSACVLIYTPSHYSVWDYSVSNLVPHTLLVYYPCVSAAGAGPVVVRPDSGDPATTVVKVLEILGW